MKFGKNEACFSVKCSISFYSLVRLLFYLRQLFLCLLLYIKGSYKKIMILMIKIQKEKRQSNLWRLKINGTCGLYICLFYYLPLSLFVNFVMLYLCVLKIFFDYVNNLFQTLSFVYKIYEAKT